VTSTTISAPRTFKICRRTTKIYPRTTKIRPRTLIKLYLSRLRSTPRTSTTTKTLPSLTSVMSWPATLAATHASQRAATPACRIAFSSAGPVLSARVTALATCTRTQSLSVANKVRDIFPILTRTLWWFYLLTIRQVVSRLLKAAIDGSSPTMTMLLLAPKLTTLSASLPLLLLKREPTTTATSVKLAGMLGTNVVRAAATT
jgi:hypothetical protein